MEVALPRPVAAHAAKASAAASPPPTVEGPPDAEMDRPRRGAFYEVGGVLPLVPATTTKAPP